MLKCSRYVFSYETPSDEVEDFILRSDDLASQTYGRDKVFSRLNQVLDQARFLGWPLPRFGSEIPDDLTEIPSQGIDHIFENQAKLLVDIAPITRVMLEDGKYCSVRMVCGTTAAGDLIWKCHLLADKGGSPYVQRHNRRLKVKIKGTRIVCQTDSLPYDEKYMFECFGGEESGIWPVPFLPEFFLDRPIAQKFSPEPGVVEVVMLQEKDPVHVFAKELVPWYRPLEIDRSRALTFDENYDNQESSPENEIDDFNPGNLVTGWDTIKEDETFNLDEHDNDSQVVGIEDGWEDGEDGEDDEDEDQYDDELTLLTNVITSLTPAEENELASYDQFLSNSQITSKAIAEELRKDPSRKDEAEKWLVTAVNRLRLLANNSEKIGAVISLLERHRDQQVLVIQPRQKWAAKLIDIITDRKIEAALYDAQNKSQISRFYEGTLKVLVTNDPKEELFIEELVVISVSSFNIIPWLDWVNPSQVIYAISIKQLGYTDCNFVPEHPLLMIETENYNGPVLDIIKSPKAVEAQIEKTEQTSKNLKAKFKVKSDKGRAKSASSYDKALKLAKKLEVEGHKCEIYSPDGKETLYITGMPEQLQGEMS